MADLQEIVQELRENAALRREALELLARDFSAELFGGPVAAVSLSTAAPAAAKEVLTDSCNCTVVENPDFTYQSKR